MTFRPIAADSISSQNSNGSIEATALVRASSSGRQYNLESAEDEVSEDSDDEANNVAANETKNWSSVPVDRLLQSIAGRAGAAETVAAASAAATALKSRAKLRDVCGESEVLVLPKQAGAALRFRGVGVLLITADCNDIKLHAKGRPSGALVLTLNTILAQLGGFDRFSVCPSGGDELLLLDSLKKTRVSLDHQRVLEASTARNTRRQLVRHQSEAALGPAAPDARPPPPSGAGPAPARQAPVPVGKTNSDALLEAIKVAEKRSDEPPQRSSSARREQDAIAERAKKKEEWDVRHPQFTKLVWYWAKRTLLGVLCHEADRLHRGQTRTQPFLRAKTTGECVHYCRIVMKQRIEKETSPTEPDYAPKSTFVESDQRITYVLDKLFVSGSRALQMDAPFTEVLFRMESHWTQLRGALIGTLKQPSLADLAPRSVASGGGSERRHTSHLITDDNDSGKSRSARSESKSKAAAAAAPSTSGGKGTSDPPANAWMSVDVDNIDDVLSAWRQASAPANAEGAGGGGSLTRGEAKKEKKDDEHKKEKKEKKESSSSSDKKGHSSSASAKKSASARSATSAPPVAPAARRNITQSDVLLDAAVAPSMFAGDDSSDEEIVIGLGANDDSDDDVDLSVIPKLK
jgi:hypothetical protein